MTRDELIEKISKVEALFKSTQSHGEMQAARGALERLQAQLAAVPEPVVEFKFALTDPWKRQLFLALVRRHNLQPYPGVLDDSSQRVTYGFLWFLFMVSWIRFDD